MFQTRKSIVSYFGLKFLLYQLYHTFVFVASDLIRMEEAVVL